MTKVSIAAPDDPSNVGTLAFHFRFVMPGEFVSDQQVAVDCLARVLRALRRDLVPRGPVQLRMEKLFYTQDLGGVLEAGWRDALDEAPLVLGPRAVSATGGFAVPLDRILVISVGGSVRHLLEEWCTRIEKLAVGRFLFGLSVDAADPNHEAIYLGAHATPLGVLHRGARLERSFESIEYEPLMSKVLNRLGIHHEVSNAAAALASWAMG